MSAAVKPTAGDWSRTGDEHTDTYYWEAIMNIEITEHVIRIVVIAPRDRVDSFTAPDLRERLHAILDDGGKNLVIDLSQTPFLDSAGMAVLVSALKRSRQLDGDTKLVWPQQEAARRVLHLTKFDRVFDMTDTAEAAIVRFSVLD